MYQLQGDTWHQIVLVLLTEYFAYQLIRFIFLPLHLAE